MRVGRAALSSASILCARGQIGGQTLNPKPGEHALMVITGVEAVHGWAAWPSAPQQSCARESRSVAKP